MTDTVIELEGLTRRYGEREALAEVSLTVKAGQTLVVFGPNGAGKTTLLRVLATLLRPHAGTARVLGHALPKDGWKVRGQVGFLGHASLLYRDLTARAVLHDPPLLLLDEPTANLDPHATDLMEPLIGASSGRTRVLTSHDPVGGLQGADVALGLRAGRAELLAPAASVTRDAIGALYA